uniref:Uncharacterized protein n=1 Tax=Daphnia magna TaxID=35525 RepID=A0A0P4X461_9CRUS
MLNCMFLYICTISTNFVFFLEKSLFLLSLFMKQNYVYFITRDALIFISSITMCVAIAIFSFRPLILQLIDPSYFIPVPLKTSLIISNRSSFTCLGD